MPDDPMEWLHRNDNYVPARVGGYRTVETPHTQGNLLGLLLLRHCTRVQKIKSSFIIINVDECPASDGSSSRDKLLRDRERYINMSEQDREELLQRHREHKRHAKLIMKDREETDMPTANQG